MFTGRNTYKVSPSSMRILSAMAMLGRNFTDITTTDIYDYLNDTGPPMPHASVATLLVHLKNRGFVRNSNDERTSAALSKRTRPTSRLVLEMTENGRRSYEEMLSKRRINRT